MHQDDLSNEYLGRFLIAFVVTTGIIVTLGSIYFLVELLQLFFS